MVSRMDVELIDTMGSDLTVVNSARVSFNKRKEVLDDRDIRLISYLGKHKHISPFGHCFATFRCRAPIFVARQLVKHKFLRWNEVSRRYVNEAPEFHTPVLRKQAEDKKQGSGGELTNHICDEVIRHACIEAGKQYTYLLKMGVCEEQARMILPQNTMTEWYWSGSLDAFADMVKLRIKGDTQYETQLLAKKVNDFMSDSFPYSWDALVGSSS